MALTLINKPLGHKLATAINDAVISNSAGDALVTHSATVVDNSWVYIESNFDRYNGFMYVSVISPTTFKIQQSDGSDFVEYIQAADITFQISSLDHTWQSVHLPIVYEIESSRFPTNNDATPTVIDASLDYNGYTEITSPGTFTDPEVLEYVTLIGDGPFAGPHQIIAVIGSDDIVIDIAYDAAVDFTIYTAVPYYNNYFVTVDVYGGISGGNTWATEKPTVYLASLKFIPDADNRIKFSIAEVVKSQIFTRNNLTLDTLPNNIDFFTQFHIEYKESYDQVIDGEIVVVSGDITEDDLFGNAVNSMMPFKSLNQSFMSDYIDSTGQLARWLTLQDRPVAVVGYFFDLSFILQYEGKDVNVTIFKSFGGIVTATEIIQIDNPGAGVLRIPIVPESGYDLYCVQASTPSTSEGQNISTWANLRTGVDWSLSATPDLSLTSGQTSKVVGGDYAFIPGQTYTISVTLRYTITAPIVTARIIVMDNTDEILTTFSSGIAAVGTVTEVITNEYVAEATAAEIGVRIVQGGGGGTSAVELLAVVISLNGLTITEQICLTIIEDCGSTFTNDNIRLTEDGQYRELE